MKSDSMMKTYTVKAIGLTGKTIPRLCRRLNSRGLNLDSVTYTVQDFYTGEYVTSIRYDVENNIWMKSIGNDVWTKILNTDVLDYDDCDIRN